MAVPRGVVPRLVLLLAACATADADGRIPPWIADAHQAWNTAYNARDARALAAAHAASGVVVPPSGDRVVPVGQFVRAAGDGEGFGDRMYLKPTDALETGHGVYHVVGAYASGAVNGTYYCRMAGAGAGGGMEVLVFGARGEPRAGASPGWARVPVWVGETLAAVEMSMREGRAAGVARGFFAADAGVMATGAPAATLVRGGEEGIAAYLHAAGAFKGPLQVLAVQPRRGGQLHVLAETTSANGAGTRVFMTWAAVEGAWAGRYKIVTYMAGLRR